MPIHQAITLSLISNNLACVCGDPLRFQSEMQSKAHAERKLPGQLRGTTYTVIIPIIISYYPPLFFDTVICFVSLLFLTPKWEYQN